MPLPFLKHTFQVTIKLLNEIKYSKAFPTDLVLLNASVLQNLKNKLIRQVSFMHFRHFRPILDFLKTF